MRSHERHGLDLLLLRLLPMPHAPSDNAHVGGYCISGLGFWGILLEPSALSHKALEGKSYNQNLQLGLGHFS
eukprot:scaffold200382_cov21-Tisochrysis_lutea.AAC.1